MNRQRKLTPQELFGQRQNQASQTHGAREFGSVEEMLRHDALHTPVPPSIAFRLRESIGRVPPTRPSWWRRLFGK